MRVLFQKRFFQEDFSINRWPLQSFFSFTNELFEKLFSEPWFFEEEINYKRTDFYRVNGRKYGFLDTTFFQNLIFFEAFKNNLIFQKHFLFNILHIVLFLFQNTKFFPLQIWNVRNVCMQKPTICNNFELKSEYHFILCSHWNIKSGAMIKNKLFTKQEKKELLSGCLKSSWEKLVRKQQLSECLSLAEVF